MKTILVALDGSPRTRGVLDAAATLARGLGASLVLYRALLVPPDFSAPGGSENPDQLAKYLEKEAHAELLALKTRATDVPCEIRIDQTDQPWRAIVAAGDAVNADLIVLGSHGFHGWDHMLGTTAGKVANRAHRNVMIIHESDGSKATRPGVAT
jgi:nucleotide-binding universal stress UspA family protein